VTLFHSFKVAWEPELFC